MAFSLFGIFSKSASRQQDNVPTSPREIGYEGTTEQFLHALHEAGGPLHRDGIKMIELTHGAGDALRDGRPENLQAFFALPTPEGQSEGHYLANVSRKMTTDQIKQAIEKATPAQQQQILDDALASAAGWRFDTTYQHIQKLIDAGADPSAQASRALRSALKTGLPENVELLKEKGADPKSALEQAKKDFMAGTDSNDSIRRLELYIEGYAPPPAQPFLTVKPPALK